MISFFTACSNLSVAQENAIQPIGPSAQVWPYCYIDGEASQAVEQFVGLLDYETEAHTLRVTDLALKLAQSVGLSQEQVEGIRIGSLLHDIGKIVIPEQILFKHGELTGAEWEIMKNHPKYAYDLMSPFTYFQNALDVPLCHHERWNGNGYPRGLRAEEIPLVARIVTIADVWDALSSDRSYRPAWDIAAVKDFMVEQSADLFDPALVALFLRDMNKAPLPLLLG